MTTAWTFQATSTIVIVGYNPENADYTNPRGAITGLMHFVQAHNEHGDTRELAVLSAGNPEAAAQALADRLNARFERLGRLPVGFDLWPAGRPIYGSEAYIEYGQADDIATEARELEDERFGY